MNVFEKANIGNVTLNNRIIRSATFEGMSSKDGIPNDQYYKMYNELSKNNIGGIIIGFTYISNDGKAMQPGQAGFYSKKFIDNYKKLTNLVHKKNCKIFIQLVHTGRQTKSSVIHHKVLGVSDKKSTYFNEKPHVLNINEIEKIIDDFALVSNYAKQSGFDGVQLHAAHGYLIHQFILSSINNRKDQFGINKKLKIGTYFLSRVIDKIRDKCGKEFPLLIKISGSDDYLNKFTKQQFINLIKFLDNKKVNAIEISYGTMDNALNISRGTKIPIDTILKYNPIYKIENKLFRSIWKVLIYPLIKINIKKFTPCYNLKYALLAKKHTDIPIISVGGIRKGEEILYLIENENIDFVSLCRPFIIEPDFVYKLLKNKNYISKCINCNICFVMCDSKIQTKCYSFNKEAV